MMKNKKIGLLATVLVASLVVGVFAAIQLSNNLTANWVVKESQGNLVLSWYDAMPTGDLYIGNWYYPQIRLQNVGVATYKNVIVKFEVWADVALPEGSVVVQGNWGTGLQNIVTWNSGKFVGTWGPAIGFEVGPGYNVLSQFQYKFEGNAPVDVRYYFNAWVETVP
jgi:hypothetical protein